MIPDQQSAFDKFWMELWPKCRRIDKKKALEQWARIPAELYDVIYAAVLLQKKQPGWQKDNCAFVPYPHRWLRDRRWEDEISLPEDKDADTLIEALMREPTMPQSLPKHIADRCLRMCRNKQINWPRLHHRLGVDPDAAEKIMKDYLATE